MLLPLGHEEGGPKFAFNRREAGATERVFSPPPQSQSSQLQPSHTTAFPNTQRNANMSSPASRRTTRSSANNTPQRRTQRASQQTRSSEPPMSDPPLPDADDANSQLQAEAAASQQGTPRASQNTQSQSQAPPTSSPLFFRSSPAGSQSQSQSQSLGVPAANGVGSSPLRQRTDAPTPGVQSSEGGRTPRANGGIGGEQLKNAIRRSGNADKTIRLITHTLRSQL